MKYEKQILAVADRTTKTMLYISGRTAAHQMDYT